MSHRTSRVRLVAAVLLATGGCRAARSSYVARDESLRAMPLYFYPSRGAPQGPVVFFFGNDVGFWEAHQRLAERLSDAGYPVIGFDERSMLKSLPDSAPEIRNREWGTRVDALIAAARHELAADTLPMIIGGHSIGAEIAFWTAAHAAPPRLVGVLALSPGSRGHLGVSVSDIMNAGEPKGPESFAVAEQVSALPASVRVALVRGQQDDYRYADSAIVAAGGKRAQRYFVPFAGHSLKKLILMGPQVDRAMRWLSDQ